MFETSETPVLHSQRIVRLSDGSALIWPYYNLPVTAGPWEIAVDSNRLERTQWVGNLRQQIPTADFTVDLFPALAEKWLASPAFRLDTINQIQVIIDRYKKGGVDFPVDYVTNISAELETRQDALRYQWTLIFFYVAVLKKIIDIRDTEQAMERLVLFSTADVPRASALLSLGALCLFLKTRQSVRLTDDPHSGYSHVQRFFSFQPGRKGEEDHINQSYLRNRGLDLALFYFWPVRDIQNRKPKAQPVVITEDKALYSLVFRMLPLMYLPKQSGPAIPVAIALDELPLSQRVAFESLRSRINVSFEPPCDGKVRRQRLENLYLQARALADRNEEQSALETIWQDWCLPGLPEPAA
ncbi:hypothetical protein [Agrobacterium tumefaciens]|uniref:Uncharacterized protein n=1 Tax=Agrobacterium tumefaciens TaxID=358 RepID=A0A2L2LMH4_AGRTU|nr:hypothetical protein [Agrobacterium tumefaciens]AVH45540.1 hypothetical protein At1D1609_55090 [Agrobacterium tumefaciens]NSY99338.1 hypothetical protein [Agrobacterium tumefaciens]